MSILIDISPTAVTFLYNGKIHQIKEIMESEGGLMITTKEQRSEEPQIDEVMLEPIKEE